jgi:hypothetical protein
MPLLFLALSESWSQMPTSSAGFSTTHIDFAVILSNQFAYDQFIFSKRTAIPFLPFASEEIPKSKSDGATFSSTPVYKKKEDPTSSSFGCFSFEWPR